MFTGNSDTILDMYDYGGISFQEEKKINSSFFSSVVGRKNPEYINTAPYWAKFSIKQALTNAKEGAGVGFLAGGFFAYAFLRNPSPYTPIETHLARTAGFLLTTTIAGAIIGISTHQKV